jgi:protein-disulfide isomerase
MFRHWVLAASAVGISLAWGQAPKAAPKAMAQKTAPAAKPSAGRSALDKATLEAYARHLLLWGPSITVQVADARPAALPGYFEVKVTGSAGGVTQDEIFYVHADGKKMVRGSVFDIAQNPFAEELGKLKTEMQPSQGTPGAPVVLVVFSDFQCSYCRQTAKTLQENLLKTFPKEVRMYFKDFPLDAIHPWARTASIAGRCVFRQNARAFWDYHDWIFDKQAEITLENLRTKLMEWAGTKNLDTMQLGRCVDGKSTEAEVEASVADAKALRIDSTPTLFVNGRRLPGSIPWQTLKQVIDFELDYQKKNDNAGEKCCELKLSPVPGK